MRLVFNRTEDGDSVSIMTKDGQESAYNYIGFIRQIYNDRMIEDPIVNGDFADEEIESIHSLVKNISDNVNSLFSNDINKDD